MPRLPSLLKTQRLLRRRRFYIAGVLFAAALLLRLYHLDYRSIWMDEDRQAAIAGGGINVDLFFRAAGQQQPPLDYAAEKLGLMIFGWTEIGARVHAALWGAGASALFFLLLRSLALHPAAQLLGTAAFVMNPLLVRYSQEGRPISCGVFFAVVWLTSLMKMLRTKPAASFGKRLLQQRGLFGATLLFLFSVGFQPPVFLSTATVALLGTTAVSPRLRRSIGAMLVSIGIAFIAALPVLLLTLREGASYMNGDSPLDKLTAVAEHLADFPVTDYLKRLYELVGSLWAVAVICIPAGIAAIIRAVRRGHLCRFERSVLLFSAIFIFAYPVLLNGLYFGLVKRHGLEARYYLTAVPPLLLFFSVLASYGAGLFAAALRAGTPLRKAVTIAVTVAAMIGFFVPTTSVLQTRYKMRGRTDWRGFYTEIKKDPKAFGTAYLMNLVPPKRWAPVRFYATRFYYRTKDKHPIALKMVDAMIGDLYRDALVSGADVYWAIPYGHDALKKRMFKKSSVDCFGFKRLTVLHLRIKDNPVAEVLALFDRAAETAVRNVGQYKLVELQTELRILVGDRKGAKKSLRRLSKLDKQGTLRPTVIARLKKFIKAMDD